MVVNKTTLEIQSVTIISHNTNLQMLKAFTRIYFTWTPIRSGRIQIF